VELVPIWALFDRGGDVMKVLPGREREYTTMNNHVEALLWSMFESAFPSLTTFQLAFDRLEVLFALTYAVPCVQKHERYWTLPGAYGWRTDNRVRIFSELRKELETLGDRSPCVVSGLIGTTAELGLENLSQLEQFVPEFRWR
jgi:hypothetical protein